MPLPQEVHDHSTGEPETVSELHRVGYTGLDMISHIDNYGGHQHGIRDRETLNMELERRITRNGTRNHHIKTCIGMGYVMGNESATTPINVLCDTPEWKTRHTIIAKKRR